MAMHAATACKYARMLAWDDLRIFLAVHRSASHAAAGRSLGVNATTIGRRIAALERATGARLFQRTPHGLGTTAAGALLLPRAERIEAEVLASERDLAGADARLAGRVRLTAGDGLMTHVLVPRLLELRRAHPAIELELCADNRPLDLSRREADVAVRLFRPREPSLVVKRLARVGFGVFGSESYFARNGRPQRLADLESHGFVGYNASGERFPTELWLREQLPDARVALRTNTTSAMVAACIAGHGLAVLPDLLAAATGQLTRVALRPPLPPSDLWAVTHADTRSNARVKAVLSWLTRIFQDA